MSARLSPLAASQLYVLLLLLLHPLNGLVSRTTWVTVVKLLSKRWWIHTGARLEVPKLEPEGPRAEVGFPTADQGFSSIRGILFGFYGI